VLNIEDNIKETEKTKDIIKKEIIKISMK